MSFLALADNFLAGSLLTMLLPVCLLIAIAVWYVVSIGHIPGREPAPAADPDPVPEFSGSVPTGDTGATDSPESGADAGRSAG